MVREAMWRNALCQHLLFGISLRTLQKPYRDKRERVIERGCSTESNVESNARLRVNFLDDSNMKRVKREGDARECTPRVNSARSISRLKLRGDFMRVINVARPPKVPR